jgi:pimeloyl-ACP methyl ester carboxylesterase
VAIIEAQNRIFTLAITAISRCLIVRDRFLGRLRVQEAADSATIVKAYLLPSGRNLLDARFVMPTEGAAKAGVLICHGIGETVAHWAAVQALLAREGVASLVFDYSGYGKSTGRITFEQCEADTLIAFKTLRQLVPTTPLSILGYSLGSGIAVAVTPELKPGKLIVCAGFSSLRKAAASLGVPSLLTRLLPPIWSNIDALKIVTVPVLVLHGSLDSLFPPGIAHQLGSNCNSPCEVIVVAGLSHNGPMYRPNIAYWSLVTSRL